MKIAVQRRVGFILGVTLGFGFSAAANLINKWLMPEIPFEAAWPGAFWLTFFSVGMFGLLGVLAAWTEENIPGILLSALVGTLVSSIWILISDTSNRTGTLMVILFFVFLPRMFFYLPFSWLIRTLVDKVLYKAPDRKTAPVKKLILVFVAFLIAVVIGTSTRVSESEQKSLTRMKEIIEEGLLASSYSELPEYLQDVNGFVEKAEGEYSFSLGANPDVLAVQRPFVDYGAEEPFIIVKFNNGFRFGCVFSPPYVVPACIDF